MNRNSQPFAEIGIAILSSVVFVAFIFGIALVVHEKRFKEAKVKIEYREVLGNAGGVQKDANCLFVYRILEEGIKSADGGKTVRHNTKCGTRLVGDTTTVSIPKASVQAVR